MSGYFILLLIFLLFFSLSFGLALQEWFRPRDASPLPVDVEYIREENYFGVSFRKKMEEWLLTARELPPPQSPELPASSLLKTSEREKIVVVPAGGSIGSRMENAETVYSVEDFLFLEPLSQYRGEIYSRGSLESGPGVRLRAVAADGDLILGERNSVSRWVDARGKILLRRGTITRSRVSSLDSIELEPGVSAQSLYAPLVFTHGYRPLELPPVSRPLSATASEMPAYLNGVRCVRLAADTWLVQGDLLLDSGASVGSKLVIQGSFQTEPDCYLSHDVKAFRVKLGARNKVFGNIIYESEVEVGESSFVSRSVAAETDVVLRSGTRVGLPEALAVVSAGGQVRLEFNVAVCGKLAADRAVLAL
ncbi:MAG: hypothetical protein HY648_08265 [Acidobacteria bacterium]|nr:hypothetical protein [Acidobacteriota bacterium]